MLTNQGARLIGEVGQHINGISRQVDCCCDPAGRKHNSKANGKDLETKALWQPDL